MGDQRQTVSKYESGADSGLKRHSVKSDDSSTYPQDSESNLSTKKLKSSSSDELQKNLNEGARVSVTSKIKTKLDEGTKGERQAKKRERNDDYDDDEDGTDDDNNTDGERDEEEYVGYDHSEEADNEENEDELISSLNERSQKPPMPPTGIESPLVERTLTRSNAKWSTKVPESHSSISLRERLVDRMARNPSSDFIPVPERPFLPFSELSQSETEAYRIPNPGHDVKSVKESSRISNSPPFRTYPQPEYAVKREIDDSPSGSGTANVEDRQSFGEREGGLWKQGPSAASASSSSAQHQHAPSARVLASEKRRWSKKKKRSEKSDRRSQLRGGNKAVQSPDLQRYSPSRDSSHLTSTPPSLSVPGEWNSGIKLENESEHVYSSDSGAVPVADKNREAFTSFADQERPARIRGHYITPVGPKFRPGGDAGAELTRNTFENTMGASHRYASPQWREAYGRLHYPHQRPSIYGMPILTPSSDLHGHRPPSSALHYADPMYGRPVQSLQLDATQTFPRRGEQIQAMLEVQGNLRDMTRNWSVQETKIGRRLVKFERAQRGVVVYLRFEPIDPKDYNENMCAISCIWRRETQEYFVTSVDCISLLELIINQKFSVEEKNRIRRNLEVCKPITVSKSKPELASFFRLIMAFSEPRPRNIEKDVKVFLWSKLENALKKIVSKYSASWAALNG